MEQTETAVKSPPFFGVLSMFLLQMLVEFGSFIVDFLAPFAPEHVDNILSGLRSGSTSEGLDPHLGPLKTHLLLVAVTVFHVRFQRKSTPLL